MKYPAHNQRGLHYGEIACPECNGAGYFFSDNGPSPIEFECEVCEGSGKVDSDDE